MPDSRTGGEKTITCTPTHSAAVSVLWSLTTRCWFQNYLNAFSLANLSITDSGRQGDGLHHRRAKRGTVTEALVRARIRRDKKERTGWWEAMLSPAGHPLASVTEDSVTNSDVPFKSKPKDTSFNLRTCAQSLPLQLQNRILSCHLLLNCIFYENTVLKGKESFYRNQTICIVLLYHSFKWETV